MKSIVAAILIFGVTSSCFARFLIYSADHTTGHGTESVVLKLDTDTGQAWMFVMSIITGPTVDGSNTVFYTFGWKPVPQEAKTEQDTVPAGLSSER